MTPAKMLPLLGMALMAAAWTSTASAADTTTTFQTSASIASSCSITAPRPVKFLSNYDPVLAHKTTENASRSGFGAIGVTCNRQPQPVFVRLNEGLTPSAGSSCSVPLRNMVTADGARLPYTLWVGNGPSATTQEWGCAETNQKSLSFQEVNTTSTSIAGKIAPGLDVKGGSYADTVTATVVF